MAIHIETPALASRAFSLRSGKDVRLKMEALQPSGSFKARGIGHACQIYKSRGARRFISSSGGNAGYAVAYAGRMLATPVTVVVPATTSERAKSLIRSEGAEVIVHGASWMEANAHALELMTPADAFLHPFDDPLLWEGHATMIDELARQGGRPDVVICSVGGGGRYVGKRAGDNENSFWMDSYTVADAFLRWDLPVSDYKTRLQLNVDNLFDKHYYPSNTGSGQLQVNEGEPRTARLTASVTF